MWQFIVKQDNRLFLILQHYNQFLLFQFLIHEISPFMFWNTSMAFPMPFHVSFKSFTCIPPRPFSKWFFNKFLKSCLLLISCVGYWMSRIKEIAIVVNTLYAKYPSTNFILGFFVSLSNSSKSCSRSMRNEFFIPVIDWGASCLYSTSWSL